MVFIIGLCKDLKNVLNQTPVSTGSIVLKQKPVSTGPVCFYVWTLRVCGGQDVIALSDPQF